MGHIAGATYSCVWVAICRLPGVLAKGRSQTRHGEIGLGTPPLLTARPWLKCPAERAGGFSLVREASQAMGSPPALFVIWYSPAARRPPMPSRERPIKLEMTFPEAIRLFATPPSERPSHSTPVPNPDGTMRKDSTAEESGNTTAPADPEPVPAEPQTEYHPSLFDYLPENQTHEDTSADSDC